MISLYIRLDIVVISLYIRLNIVVISLFYPKYRWDINTSLSFVLPWVVLFIFSQISVDDDIKDDDNDSDDDYDDADDADAYGDDDDDDDDDNDDDNNVVDDDGVLTLATLPETPLIFYPKVSLGFPRDIAAEILHETKAREADSARVKAEGKLSRLLDHRRRLLDVLKASQVCIPRHSLFTPRAILGQFEFVLIALAWRFVFSTEEGVDLRNLEPYSSSGGYRTKKLIPKNEKSNQ